jgi:hypothetical protein
MFARLSQHARPRVASCSSSPLSPFITSAILSHIHGSSLFRTLTLSFAVLCCRICFGFFGDLQFHRIRRHIRQLRHCTRRPLGYAPRPCGSPNSNVCFSCFSCEENLYMLKEILRRHVVFTSIAAQENTRIHMHGKFFVIGLLN